MIITNKNIRKEVCGPCNKFINIGQPILECELCFTAIHTKCYKKASFSPHNGIWTCQTCFKDASLRYNPYSLSDIDHDKFYDDDGAYDDTIIQKISEVLQSCKSYVVKDLNKLLIEQNSGTHDTSNTDGKQLTQFSSYFLNIDGNKTNFEHLNVELKRIKHDFSVIALAETNVDPALQNLYQMTNYSAFYQSTLEGKTKGTGVALYIHDQFNAELLDELSFCNPNICLLYTSPSPRD